MTNEEKIKAWDIMYSAEALYGEYEIINLMDVYANTAKRILENEES